MILSGKPKASSVVRKFICVLHNGETYVTYAETKEQAVEECTHRSGYGKPWKVLTYPQGR
jgi:hypothetical protein